MSNPYQSPSDVSTAETTLPPEARAGRTFIVILIVANTSLALAVIGLALAAGQNDRLPRLLFRLLANIALMYGLWRGSVWIKWLFVLGFSLAALACVALVFRYQSPYGLLIIPLAALLAWVAWNLAFGVSVDEFFAFQRSKSNPG